MMPSNVSLICCLALSQVGLELLMDGINNFDHSFILVGIFFSKVKLILMIICNGIHACAYEHGNLLEIMLGCLRNRAV
jgi:hypothetical protein